MCVFCQIVEKKVSSQIIFENEHVVAFRDIHPKAPVHALMVTRKHIRSINDLSAHDETDISALLLAAKEVAQILNVAHGYKLAFNVERAGGQVIDHIHMHLLAWPNDYKNMDGHIQKEVITP